MLKPFPLSAGCAIASAIASTSILIQSAIARPIPLLQSESLPRVDASAPVCYIQFQGSRAIDVSQVCGKSGAAPDGKPISVSKAAVPPVFNPRVMNASTTGQCNFVDANGNPCPRTQQPSLKIEQQTRSE